MKFFGRKAAVGDNARPALARYGGGAAIGDWPRSYEAQVRAAYLDNAIAQRAVRLVADGVGGAPLTGHGALIALATRSSGGQALLDSVAAHLLLHGNAFIQVMGDGAGGIGGLYALRPERVGSARWRLSRLLRGRRGSEPAITSHMAGEGFALLAPETIAVIDLPVATLGTTVQVMASGIGDLDGPIVATCPVGGASVAPPSPVAPLLDADGATVRWTRRSRAGFRWIDGGDVSIAEEGERYRVEIAVPGSAMRIAVVGEPACALMLGEFAPATSIAIRQLGTVGESAPAVLTL